MQYALERRHDNPQSFLFGGLKGALFNLPLNPLPPIPATPKKQFTISNNALPCIEAVMLDANEGEELVIDLINGLIFRAAGELKITPAIPFLIDVMARGGIIETLREKYENK